ncbi:unnamed protein product [Ranitomeya imitator]|uniref:FK506-binding protein 15-like domain-containing protein n=1 Tax=Ranitomeya imitator TaxID=111125 RepID=A0ABN9KPU1_9NEOB|nr:unnamed protein product [Ranitomeya imitator]
MDTEDTSGRWVIYSVTSSRRVVILEQGEDRERAVRSRTAPFAGAAEAFPLRSSVHHPGHEERGQVRQRQAGGEDEQQLQPAVRDGAPSPAVHNEGAGDAFHQDKGRRKGCAASKSTLARWIRATIQEAYRTMGMTVPAGIKAHSTRAVGASWAVWHQASAEQVCKAATWSSLHTFVKHYNVHSQTSADASLGRRILQAAVAFIDNHHLDVFDCVSLLAAEAYTHCHCPVSPNERLGEKDFTDKVIPQAPLPMAKKSGKASAKTSGDVTSFLMTEARQQSTEIRMGIGKVIDKIDTLASKVDNLQKENSSGASHLLPGLSSITMESAMIMNNIQRIIQENERLKQEVLDKSSRIEEQNVKIGELINRNRNQRYVEQSNMLMEQRNDSLKNSTENTQAKMLHAMQEKAKVAEELSAATGQLSCLQLEVTAYQKKEMDLRTQLAASLQEAEKCRLELGSLQAQLIELKETSEQTKNRAKTEKDSRRTLELRLTALEEEISDLKIEKENLEKSLTERKKKSQQERQRAEEEQEELRRSFHEENETLRQQLKKSREQMTAEQLSSSSSRDRDEQRLMELQDQAAQLQPLKVKCGQLQSQITSLRDQLGEMRDRESDLLSAKDRVEQAIPHCPISPYVQRSENNNLKNRN